MTGILVSVVPTHSSPSADSSVLGSTLPEHILRLLQPGPKLNLGVAVEFAWCLHYIICR